MKIEPIIGEKITLIAAELAHKHIVYEWGAESDIAHRIFNIEDEKFVTYEDFDKDYENFYFDGSQPFLGRGYVVCTKEPVGFISYSAFEAESDTFELDIWLACEAQCGKGYGTEAIKLLGDYLFENFDIKRLLILPSSTNLRAIKSYIKAGFVQQSDETREAMHRKYSNRDEMDENHTLLFRYK
ncbi:MAG: GNAT family N-acetyltransferase [Clostridiales bacterium]|nr:GNAT family N-acetyltransferase [Clostridiales bacterium]